uniref:Arsenite methyltransferase n=1 Tax=Petromyzon marinus TaxID=7757 RepID=A0AAJ7TV65_PETMA|nr:arsenite methyltransferase-like [Petromyzon marinus]
MDGQQIHDSVKDYYGKKLQTSEDLQTDVACTLPAKKPSKMIQDAMALIHPAIMSRYFGCGLVVPECLDGCSVLDLGSGSGRDCFLLGKLVGAQGSVTGIDMTMEMIETGNAHVEYHRERFGYAKSNVNFVAGYLEKLGEAGLGDNTFDIIVSNCVICLCPDKKLVLKEAYKVLKTGGEMYYSDMYANAVVPSDIKSSPCLWGEGMGGAMFWKELIGVSRALGFSRPYLVTASHITITNADTCKKLGPLRYASGTYRMFKLPSEGTPPGPGSRVTYLGSAPNCGDTLAFDHQHTFPRGEPVAVDAELATVIRTSRLAPHFSVELGEGAESGTGTADDSCMDPFSLAAQLGSCVSKRKPKSN